MGNETQKDQKKEECCGGQGCSCQPQGKFKCTPCMVIWGIVLLFLLYSFLAK